MVFTPDGGELMQRSEISVAERATANSCKPILASSSELANSTELGSHLEIFL
jgi:hypothetical protein